MIFIYSNNWNFAQGGRINFQKLQNNLSNQHIKCIIKDSKGYLWFGTSEGLNKFDGTNITIYESNSNDTNSLTNNNITLIYENKNKELIIGTSKGLCIYNREKENFRKLRFWGNWEVYITSLIEDKNNNLWFGTAGIGLYRYDQLKKTLHTYNYDINNVATISSNFINSIAIDNKNRVWVGSRNGIDLYDSKNNSFVRFNNKISKGLNSIYVKQISIDKNGAIWLGTLGNGLFKLFENGKNWQFEHFFASGKKGSLSHNDVLSILNDENGNTWIGTENGGLNFIPSNSKEISVYKNEDGNPYSISSNSIWSLYKDYTGIIWIGTYNQGLNIIDNKIEKFELFQRNSYETKTLVNNNVTNFSEGLQGNIWIATDGGGISTFDTQTKQFTNTIDNSKLTSKSLLSVLQDTKQRLWVGTWAGGVDLFTVSGKKVKNYKFELNKRPGNIFTIYEDKSGNIWVGTAGNGLHVYDPKTDSFKKIYDENNQTHLSVESYINVVFQDSEGTLWIGIPYSLISMKIVNGQRVLKQYRPTADTASLSSSIILTIFEDSNNNIWVGTDNGLNMFDKKTGKFTVYRKENGLPNNTIRGILEDNNHCLWISTYNGISKFDMVKKTFKNYSKNDGLASNNFNRLSCMKASSGELFFGCNNGFVAFFPDSIKTNTYIPPVYFTGLKVFNNSVVIGAEGSPLSKSIGETQTITLNHKQTSFTIEFAALNFTHSAKNQYTYILEGFDKSWSTPDIRNYASYTNINAGKYTFKVKGSNNEDIWNPEPIQLEIIVLPPFWKTIWAYLLYSLLTTLILWGFIKLLIIKSNQAEKLRLEQIHHEKSEELNRMKIQFFANISHEFRTPLSLILPPLKQIIDNITINSDIKKPLEMVYRNANKLFNLVNELMDFTKSEEGRLKMMVQKFDIVLFVRDICNLFKDEAHRRSVDFRFETSTDSIEVWFDKSKMDKVISNLLSNAFKFTPDSGIIKLKIDKEMVNGQSYVTISIVDNGCGISNEYINKVFDRFYQSPEEDNKHVSGTGIGLALTKSLVEMHHGTITVTSQKWKETCFTVKLLLGNNHFEKNELFDEEEGLQMLGNPYNNDDNISNQAKPDKNAPLVLIVEDNSELREYLVTILSAKFNVLKASDGAEGLKIAQETTPDLILSDVVMPRLSGTDLCKAIKNEMATSHIPVILLTSKASTPEIVEGIEFGADAYITKPFDISHLKVTIDKTIENRRKLYQRFSQDIYLMPKENSENELDRKFLEKIVDYIDKNVSNTDITVETLANYMIMSRTNVYRKIKSITGQTATDFIKTVRLKMSIKLLESGKYNITEIAFNLGFTSPGYFTKCFKDQYGKTPSEYLGSNIK